MERRVLSAYLMGTSDLTASCSLLGQFANKTTYHQLISKVAKVMHCQITLTLTDHNNRGQCYFRRIKKGIHVE